MFWTSADKFIVYEGSYALKKVLNEQVPSLQKNRIDTSVVICLVNGLRGDLIETYYC